ncbi:MAG: hypothetical protein ACTHK8_21520 [Ginsengibacter sp.]
MIIVKPQAGLGNRMRVINSCLVLQKRNRSAGEIKLVWENENVLNCQFTDLFQPIENVTLIDSNYFLTYFSFFNYQKTLSLKQDLKKRLLSPIVRKFAFYDNDIILPLRFKTDYWDTTEKHFLIDTYSDFYDPKYGNYYHLFKPIVELQKKITNQMRQFVEPTIGVHIRRTDNLSSIERSRDELFIKCMYKKLKDNDRTLFFLSSDDLKTEELFKKEFGNNLITRFDKDLNRNNKIAVQDALVDLYLLAGTKEIIGSYGSSFSRVASLINSIPLTIIS